MNLPFILKSLYGTIKRIQKSKVNRNIFKYTKSVRHLHTAKYFSETHEGEYFLY